MKSNSKLFYTNLIYFICAALFVVVRIITASIDTSGMDAYLDEFIFTFIIQVGLFFVLPITLYSFFRKQKFQQTFLEFKFRKISFKIILISIGIGVACYVLNIAISSFFQGMIRMFGYEAGTISRVMGGTSIPDTSIWAFLITLVLTAVLPAVCEETVHRGMLLNGFSTMGLKRSVIMSSLFFGLMHMSINQFGYTMVLGVLMSITVVISQNIWPAIIIHFINNGIITYLSYASTAGLIGGDLLAGIDTFIATSGALTVFVVIVIFLCVLTLILLGLYWLLLKETRIKKIKLLFKQVINIDGENSVKIKELNKSPKNPAAAAQNLAVLEEMFSKYNVKTTQDLIFTNEEFRFNKPTKWENLFFYGVMALGIVITIFTFIWGLL